MRAIEPSNVGGSSAAAPAAPRGRRAGAGIGVTEGRIVRAQFGEQGERGGGTVVDIDADDADGIGGCARIPRGRGISSRHGPHQEAHTLIRVGSPLRAAPRSTSVVDPRQRAVIPPSAPASTVSAFAVGHGCSAAAAASRPRSAWSLPRPVAIAVGGPVEGVVIAFVVARARRPTQRSPPEPAQASGLRPAGADSYRGSLNPKDSQSITRASSSSTCHTSDTSGRSSSSDSPTTPADCSPCPASFPRLLVDSHQLPNSIYVLRT